jgi:hypothetical protein
MQQANPAGGKFGQFRVHGNHIVLHKAMGQLLHPVLGHLPASELAAAPARIKNGF